MNDWPAWAAAALTLIGLTTAWARDRKKDQQDTENRRQRELRDAEAAGYKRAMADRDDSDEIKRLNDRVRELEHRGDDDA